MIIEGNMFYKNIQDIPLPTMKGGVAIKLHMGERGNTTCVSPDDVRALVERIKAAGGRPFLFDTTTLYRRARYTPESYRKVAEENGFGEFEIVVPDDGDSNVRVIGGYPVPVQLLEADAMLVLSHAKGHIFTAFGGALKNLSMGCVNKDGKRKIHIWSKPRYDETKCIKCGACVKACDDSFVKLNDRVTIDLTDCTGCGACIEACPQGALWREKGSVEKSFERFAEAAKAVLSEFKSMGKPVFCINVLKNITEHCDCAVDVGRIVCPDIGYVAGKNPLEVDMETVKLIRDRSPDALKWEAWELFAKIAGRYF